MARGKKDESVDLVAVHSATMSKCRDFAKWADRHLRNGDVEKFKAVYDAVKKLQE